MSGPAKYMDATAVNDNVECAQAIATHKTCITILNLLDFGIGNRTILWQLVRGLESMLQNKQPEINFSRTGSIGGSTHSEGKADPVDNFICATANCDGLPNAKAREQLVNNPVFTNVCTGCHCKKRAAKVAAGLTKPPSPPSSPRVHNLPAIVLLVSTSAPTQISKAERNEKKKAQKIAARQRKKMVEPAQKSAVVEPV